jgi:biopolymer transport protein ExbD
MGMDVGGPKGGPKGDINMTPLIDIVLVLLIIFMVLTPSLLKHHTANVPQDTPSDVPPPPEAANNIIVELNKDRDITVNAEPVLWEALADKLSDRLKKRDKKLVFFKIDDDANYGDAVRLMDTARGAGATTLGIVT